MFKELKKRIGQVMLTLLFCLLSLGFGQTANAREKSYESTYLTQIEHGYYAGGLYVWTDKTKTKLYCCKRFSQSGEEIWTASSDESLMPTDGGTRFSTNGTYVYFAVYKKDSSVTVIQLNVKTKKAKTVCKYKGSYGAFYGYYKNKVLLTRKSKKNSVFGISLYSYNTKTKKCQRMKKDIDGGGSRQYGKYIVYLDINGIGAYPEKLYIFNIDTGKTVKISKSASFIRIMNGKVYYLEELSNGLGVIKSSTMAGRMKSITPKFKWSGIVNGCRILIEEKHATVRFARSASGKSECFKISYNKKSVSRMKEKKWNNYFAKHYGAVEAAMFS